MRESSIGNLDELIIASGVFKLCAIFTATGKDGQIKTE